MSEITLALGGGGIKGIAHVGVLRILEKSGIKIRAISGTSAGGIVGALFAAGYSPDQIENLINTVDQRSLFKRGDNEGPSLLGLSGLVDVLSQQLDDFTFTKLKIPFACTAVDIHTSTEIIINQGNVLDAVQATIAVPGVFPPKEIGDYRLVDGGVLDPVPAALARHLNPTLPVIAVSLTPEPEKWIHLPPIQLPAALPIPSPIVDRIARFRISQALQIFVKSMDISSRMLAELRLQIDKPEIIIRPDVVRYGMLDEVAPSDLIRAGEEAAEHCLPQIEELFTLRKKITRQLFKSQAPLPGKYLDVEDKEPEE